MRERAQPGSPDDILLDLARTMMAISIRAADRLGDVSAVQLRGLTVLRENPGANLMQLAQEMDITVSTASRLVDRLVAARLVDRRPSTHTRREISLTLTQAGTALLQRYDRLRLADLRTRFDRVPLDQQQDVLAGLRALLDDPGEPAGRSS